MHTTYTRSSNTVLVRYEGTRDELIAAGVATADMFPLPGQRRRFTAGPKCSPRYYAMTAQGRDSWLLTRWAEWDAPGAAERSAELVAGVARHNAEIAERGAQEFAALRARVARAKGLKPELVWSAPAG